MGKTDNIGIFIDKSDQRCYYLNIPIILVVIYMLHDHYVAEYIRLKLKVDPARRFRIYGERIAVKSVVVRTVIAKLVKAEYPVVKFRT